MELDEELELDLQVLIKDAVYEGVTSDAVLGSILALTIKDISGGKPLFPNPMDEPILYSRCIRPWVQQAIETLQKLNQKEQK